MQVRLWDRLRKVSMTPFGSPVEPLVYWYSTMAQKARGGADRYRYRRTWRNATSSIDTSRS